MLCRDAACRRNYQTLRVVPSFDDRDYNQTRLAAGGEEVDVRIRCLLV